MRRAERGANLVEFAIVVPLLDPADLRDRRRRHAPSTGYIVGRRMRWARERGTAHVGRDDTAGIIQRGEGRDGEQQVRFFAYLYA